MLVLRSHQSCHHLKSWRARATHTAMSIYYLKSHFSSSEGCLHMELNNRYKWKTSAQYLRLVLNVTLSATILCWGGYLLSKVTFFFVRGLLTYGAKQTLHMENLGAVPSSLTHSLSGRGYYPLNLLLTGV